MASGNFDPSLTKYKPQKQESLSVSDLFQRFVEYKRRKIELSTLAKYLGLQKHVSLFFSNKTCVSVSERVCEKFRDRLREIQKLEPVTIREGIAMMKTSWEWGKKKNEIKVSVPPKQPPELFTLKEIQAIVEKFGSDPELQHFLDYLKVKFVQSSVLVK